MVAFAACPRSDEFVNSDYDESDGNSTADLEESASNNDRNGWKDAKRDAELTGVFCINVVSEELAWAMNATAPLGKGLSEFQLMHGQEGIRVIPTPLPAPHRIFTHVHGMQICKNHQDTRYKCK